MATTRRPSRHSSRGTRRSPTFSTTHTKTEGMKCFLIGLHRCQNFKVVARTATFSTRNPVTGKITRKGNPVKNELGDMVLVDCNVKGSDNGTPSDPNEICASYFVGARYFASLPVVHQKDNARPHQAWGNNFHQWLMADFSKRG